MSPRGANRLPSRAVDAAGAAAAFVVGVMAIAHGEGPASRFLSFSSADVGAYVVVAAAALALYWRRGYPLAVLGTEVAILIVYLAAGYFSPAMFPALAVALFTVGTTGTRRRSLFAGVVTVVVVMLAIAVATRGPLTQLSTFDDVPWLLLALVFGDAIRSRRAYVAELVRRAEEAERTREEEALRRVQEERLRIARDLHDMVAHSISIITVQSGVAAHLIHDDPEQARQALTAIQRTSKDVLSELRLMLGLLRSTDETAPLRPLSGDRDDLDALFEDFRAAGLPLRITIEGDTEHGGGDGEAGRIAAYRILQESLTNVLHHAGKVPTDVVIRNGVEGIELEIRNPRSLHPPSGSHGDGVGIIGMRERAASVGGTVKAGATEDGGFRVTAALPHRRPE